MFSCVQLFAIPWTVAYQPPLTMGFSRQENWSGMPGPPPGDLNNSGIKPRSPAFQADSLSSEPSGKPPNLENKSESEVIQSCLTLCDPMNCSPPGFSVHGILQARILEWTAISFFRGSSQPRDRICVSCITSGLLYCMQILFFFLICLFILIGG